MSLEKDYRTENMQQALLVLVRLTGEDTSLLNLRDSADPAFAKILPITWTQLERLRLIEITPLMGEASKVALTGAGWYTALQRTGRTQVDDFKQS
jgi:hypothetical protein